MKSGSDLVNSSGDKLDEIVVSVKKVAGIVAEISAASAEQSSGIDQINQAVTNMDEATQQNAALAEQTSAAAGSLDEKARELQSIIAFFSTRRTNGPVDEPAASRQKQHPQPTPAVKRSANGISDRATAPEPSRAHGTPPVDDDDWETF